jgi:glycine/D-amino acid oxidase-like deaminating enzyme
MQSIWTTTKIPARPRPSSDIKADVAVIGGGMAGILIAYQLRRRGLEVVVLEAEAIGSGQTAGTSAKITAQHGHVYARLIEQCGRERAEQYARAQTWGHPGFERVIERENIACDFEHKPAYLYSTLGTEPLEDEAEAAKSLNLPASLAPSSELPFPAAGAVRFDDQAQFHPLKFLKALSTKLTVYEKTRVMSVEPEALHTLDHVVEAKHIIFASHYPFVNKPGYYFARIHQERSYMLALEGAENLPGMYLGLEPESPSLRSYGKYLLLGGERHRTGENVPGRYEALRETAERLFPGAKEAAHWSAQDCITLDGVPFIGRYAPSRPGWHVATGFMKWGMTSSMAAAMILADDITGKRNPNATVFRPQRFSSAELPQLTRDGAHAVKGLARGVVPPDRLLKDLPPGKGYRRRGRPQAGRLPQPLRQGLPRHHAAAPTWAAS